MVQDHKKDIEKFTQEATSGQDPLVKTFAQNILPALQEHLAEAQDLRHDLFHVNTNVAAGAAARATAGAGGATGTEAAPK